MVLASYSPPRMRRGLGGGRQRLHKKIKKPIAYSAQSAFVRLYNFSHP